MTSYFDRSCVEGVYEAVAQCLFTYSNHTERNVVVEVSSGCGAGRGSE